MGDEWLNDSMVVYIEKAIFRDINDEVLLQRYQNLQNRRIQLSSIPSSRKVCLTIKGFRKLRTKFCEYEHLLFKRDEIDKLAEIPRKNSSSGTKHAVSAVQAATTSSNTGEDQEVVSLISPPRDVALYATSDEEIVRENKRLREDNAALKQELYKMKSIFSKVVGMMKTLAGDERVNASCSSGGEYIRNRN